MMSLSDLASLGSFVSGVAVLVSLVYLALQVRQTERNQQAAIRQARINRAVDLVVGKLAPGVAEAVTRGIDGAKDLTATELAMFTAYAEAYFLHAEDTFYQHQSSLLNDEAFATFSAYQVSAFASPGFRVQWKRQRAYYSGKFALYMDRLLSETKVQPAVDALARWRSDAANESL